MPPSWQLQATLEVIGSKRSYALNCCKPPLMMMMTLITQCADHRGIEWWFHCVHLTRPTELSYLEKLSKPENQKLADYFSATRLWCLTSTLEKKTDALDNWCLRRILHIHWTDFVSNDVVRSRTGQLLLSDSIRQWRLSFGHLCHADIGQDHSRALRAYIRGPPKDWRRRTGRPRQTWLRTVEDDLRPLNFGLAMARRLAMDRPAWRLLVDAAKSPGY